MNGAVLLSFQMTYLRSYIDGLLFAYLEQKVSAFFLQSAAGDYTRKMRYPFAYNLKIIQEVLVV